MSSQLLEEPNVGEWQQSTFPVYSASPGMALSLRHCPHSVLIHSSPHPCVFFHWYINVSEQMRWIGAFQFVLDILQTATFKQQAESKL